MATAEKSETSAAISKGQLKAFIERIETLETEKKETADDIKLVYQEARGQGYDVKALRTIVKMRKQDADERAEQAAILETYMAALGMFATTELGRAAIERATAPSRTRTPQTVTEIAKVLDAG